jgi:uncharacterized repeat protein (TIGR01451 family)
MLSTVRTQSFWSFLALSKTARAKLFPILLAAVWMLSLVLTPAALPSAVGTAAQAGASTLARLPLAFVPNQGQTDPQVLFQVHSADGTLFLTADSLVLALPGADALSLRYLGAGQAAISGEGLLPGKTSYLLGSSPAAWHAALPSYAAVTYRNLYPGIDLRYTGLAGAFEGTYQLAPYANPDLIRWSHSGAGAARIDPATGNLLLYSSAAFHGAPLLIEQAPQAWQEIGGVRVAVPVHFAQFGDAFGFTLGAYDPASPLTIDPTLIYSSYVGGSEQDSASAIGHDAHGNLYVAGTTFSAQFPTQAAFKGSQSGLDDAFVIKLNPAGDTLLYSTFLGGAQDDEGDALSVAADGTVYLAGDTGSTDFPTKDAFQEHCVTVQMMGCMGDAFVAVLSPSGDALVYSTYLGGSGPDSAMGITAGDSGLAYVTGMTGSTDFPTKDAYQDALGNYPGTDAFVAKLNTAATGSSSLVYATYLGGSDMDTGAAIALAGGGKVIVTGQTSSDNFPLKNAGQSSNKGNQDVFVTELAASGKSLEYSTFLGGSGIDTVYGLAVDSQGDAILSGTTASTNFPTEKPIQDKNAGNGDAFVTELQSGGAQLLFSTYWGGSQQDIGYGVAVDPAGAIYLTGQTLSSDFPTKDPLQGFGGHQDAFVSKLVPGASGPAYSTYLGGADDDTGVALALDDQHDAFVAGNTFSGDFPTQSALDDQYGGKGDVFVAEISDAGSGHEVSPNPNPPDAPHYNALFGSYTTASQSTLAKGEKLTFTIHLHNSSGSAVSADVVDQIPTGLDLVTDSVGQAGVYSTGKHTVTWTGVSVPVGQDLLLTFDVSTAATSPKMVTNTATITSQGDSFDRPFPVLIGASAPTLMADRPAVKSFKIDAKDILTDRDVTLHIQADPGVDAKWMYLKEWDINPSPFPHWDVVQSSGWVDFAETLPWKLGDQSGVHYMAVWVADKDKHVSLLNEAAVDFASLLLPETKIEAGGLIPYLAAFAKGDDVSATLTSSSGNADLFAWYPGNLFIPNRWAFNSGTAKLDVKFTAPVDGVYVFLVYASEKTTYTLKITPGGGPTVSAPASPAVAVQDTQTADASGAGFSTEPVFSQIGFDPFGTSAPAAPGAPAGFSVYLPMTVH